MSMYSDLAAPIWSRKGNLCKALFKEVLPIGNNGGLLSGFMTAFRLSHQTGTFVHFRILHSIQQIPIYFSYQLYFLYTAN